MRTLFLILVVTLTCSRGASSFAVPPDEMKDARTVSIGMQFDQAKRSLAAVNATETKYYGARGFVPRNPSDPPPPTMRLYMLDAKVRLEIAVDHDSNTIENMVVRFEAEVRARIKSNYFEAFCYAVTFHNDNSYSLRLKKNAEVKNSTEITQDPSK
jgi:hypothetical protein